MFRANEFNAVELMSMLARGDSKLAVAEHVMFSSSSLRGDRVSWLVNVGGELDEMKMSAEGPLPFRNQVIFITTLDSI